MFEQYVRIKKEYPDALLFYRMGDFYELFFQDAETAARELQITLTSRNPGAENPVPMCGVPWHAVDGYVAQLINKGYKIAFCDQVENPREAKGLVQRAVTRVYTAGTVIEDSSLDPKTHSYLGSVCWNEQAGQGGFTWADISTGNWTGLQVKKQVDLWQWVQKVMPRELLLPNGFDLPASVNVATEIQAVPLPVETYFQYKQGKERLLAAQGVADLETLGLEKSPELVQACGALLIHLEETKMQTNMCLQPLLLLNLGRHLIIDEVTERNLELFQRLDGRKGVGTLRAVLDQTRTPMGSRLLEERMHNPWREANPIETSLDVVEWFFCHEPVRRNLRDALRLVYDIERLSTRIALNRTSPKDVLALGNSLATLPTVRSALDTELAKPESNSSAPSEKPPFPEALQSLCDQWDNLDEYAQKIHQALVDTPPPIITDGGIFKAGFNPELDELLDLIEHGEGKVQELLETEQKKSGISKIKLGYNRIFGYYFEVPKSLVANVPKHFIRRQTLANGERFTTTDLKELEDRLISAADKRKTLEYKLFQELREELAGIRSRLLFMADALAHLDLWQSLATTAWKNNWIRPKLRDDQEIHITEGRHPVVESIMGEALFVPNDLHIDLKRRVILITGPNMSGKSTILRQTALICLLAQMGSFVPARTAEIGLCDRIFSRVGASDNLAQGRSTFMVEMMETARILRQATKKSLVILDEIGRGTSTFDGLALAWAVAEDLAQRSGGGIRTLFATHYHELTALEGKISGIHTMNVAIREWNNEIVFLRRLVPGPADRSYGIEVARLAGVPQPILQRAREILVNLEEKRKAMTTAVAGILPGIPQQAQKPEEKPEKPKEAVPAPEHPLLVALRDINPETMTPLDALKRLIEWKTLWGTRES